MISPSDRASHPHRPLSARNTARTTAERWLTASGFASLYRRRLRGDTLVLAYHNVVPRGEEVVGDVSLHLPVGAFAAQLDTLCETHDVVGLPELLRTPARSVRPRAVITFDDGYRGALTAGVAELEARGLPATFFIAPSFVPDRDFWWDALADGAGEVDPLLRAEALTTHRGRDGEIRSRTAERGRAPLPLPAHARAADEETIRRAARTPGITLGSHSWSHPNLARLSVPEVERELAVSLRWLRERFEGVIPWLSYPYGAWSPATAVAAAAAGYHGALRIDGGWIRGGRFERYGVPRVNIPSGVSREGFTLRAAGLLCG